jgi:hypothetical protein
LKSFELLTPGRCVVALSEGIAAALELDLDGCIHRSGHFVEKIGQVVQVTHGDLIGLVAVYDVSF